MAFYPVSDGIGLCTLDTDFGVIHTARIAPLGVMCIEVTHDNGREDGTEGGE
jgi:hypothetical protein